MKRNVTCAGFALVALALAVHPAAAQNLILNPGFESGTTNWTFASNSTILVYSSYGLTPTAAFGTRAAIFNAGEAVPTGTVSQNFATTPGQAYQASFVFGNFNANSGGSTQRVLASAINTSNAAILGSVTANDTVPGLQNTFAAIMDTSYFFAFTATGSTTTLRFADQPASTTGSSDGILDNVSVTLVVPEASTLTFVLPALGVVFAGVVRRKSRAA